jgi:streptogramin lyase
MGRTSRALVVSAAIAIAACARMAVVPSAQQGGPGPNALSNGFSITEHTVPTASSYPLDIVVDHNGNGWFTEWGTAGLKIGEMSPSGTFSEFPLQTQPESITIASDGAVWFTEPDAEKIGRITLIGGLAEFPVSGHGAPEDITAGPDGRLWFTLTLDNQGGGNQIGAMTTSGILTTFTLPHSASQPNGITTGPDGLLWFTEIKGNRIGRITTSGAITEFNIPTAGSDPVDIVTGPDGRLWFTEKKGQKIGRITTTGTMKEFIIMAGVNSQPDGIASAGGELWFTEYNKNKVSSITTTGTVVRHAIPTAASHPTSIAAAPNGTLWFTEFWGDKIGIATP